MNAEARPLNKEELEAQKRMVCQAILDGKELEKSFLGHFTGGKPGWGSWYSILPNEVFEFAAEHVRYRVKPAKKIIPLTQKDFPPFCQLNFGDGVWHTVIKSTPSGVLTVDLCHSYNTLLGHKVHYRGTDGVVHPCWKEVEE